jgi:hypothetical protein
MPKDDVTRRRHALLVDVTQAASEVSRLIHEARDLNLPVEPVSSASLTASRVATRCNQSFTYQTARFCNSFTYQSARFRQPVHECGRVPLGPPAEPPALAWRRPGSEP